MALLFWDGLDNYSSFSEFQTARTELILTTSLFKEFSTSGGRFGNCAYTITEANWWGTGLPSYVTSNALSEVWTGRAIYNRSQHNIILFAVSADDAALPANGWDTMVTVGFDGTLYAWRGSVRGNNLLANTGPGVLPAFQYRFVECRFKTDNTNGILEVWVDNNRVLNYTGNTKNTGASVSNTIKSVVIAGPPVVGGSGTGTYNDDIYVLDTTGSNHANTRLGDLRIATVLVNGDAGPNQLVTQNNSAQHWIAIDDAIPGSNNLDYITGSSLNNNATEMFTHAAPPSTPNVIHAVMIQTIASKSDAGNGYFHPALSIAGAQYNVATKALSTTWTTYTDNWTTSPATGVRWTYGEFANANIGFVIDSF